MRWLPFLLAAAAFAQSSAIQVPFWAPGDGVVDPASLSASVDGAPLEILKVHAPADDLMLLVVLDLTDDLAAVEQARRALIERIEKLPANHLVGVLSAQNGLRVLSEPTSDHQRVADAIRAQQVGGRAGLLETIEEAARIGTAVISKSGVRLAVLFVTDSDVSNYREAFNNPTINQSDGGDVSRRFDTLIRERVSRMAAALAKTQAPVFITHLAYRNDQLNVAYQTGLIALSGATGGTASVSRSLSEIPGAVTGMLDHILGHYSVRVALPDSQMRKVDVTLQTPAGLALDYRSTHALGN